MQLDPLFIETRVADIIAGMCRNGITFNAGEAQRLADVTRAEVVGLEDYFAARFPPKLVRPGGPLWGLKAPNAEDGVRSVFDWHPFNPSSVRDCIVELKALGWKPDAKTESGQDALTDDILRATPIPEAGVLAEHRALAKRLGMIENYLGFVADNGRIYHSVNPNGTITSRMTHSKPNLAQVPKTDDLRALFMATSGLVMVGVDADAIEARALAHVLTPFDRGALTTILETGSKALGTDFHSRNQRAAGLFSRDHAKTILYAMLYGAGYAKIGLTVAEDAIKAGQPFKVSFETAGKNAKNKLMAGITGYKPMLVDLVARWQRDGFVVGLDGRRLYPKGNHVVLNTLLQNAGAVIMKVALIIFDDWVKASGMQVWHLLNIHDEFQVECAPDDAITVKDHLVWAIEEAGRQLGLACPLRANGAIGANWHDTK